MPYIMSNTLLFDRIKYSRNRACKCLIQQNTTKGSVYDRMKRIRMNSKLVFSVCMNIERHYESIDRDTNILDYGCKLGNINRISLKK